jgi:4-oxalocrotonate tautomerase
MPYLHLSLSSEPSAEVAAKAAQVLTTLTAQLLGKKQELTAVAISAASRERWFIGGQAIPNGQSSFYFDIKVTEGTNTKNEKARYVQAVFESMTALLGELAPASYVVIDEVHADAWGYSGQTQEFRYIKGKPL